MVQSNQPSQINIKEVGSHIADIYYNNYDSEVIPVLTEIVKRFIENNFNFSLTGSTKSLILDVLNKKEIKLDKFCIMLNVKYDLSSMNHLEKCILRHLQTQGLPITDDDIYEHSRN